MGVRVIAGKDVFLYIGTILVGCATDVSISVNAESIDAACKSSGGWGESTPGTKTWSASISGIYRVYTDPDDDTNYSAIQLFDALDAGTLLTIKFGTATTGDTQFTGTGYVTSWEFTGGIDGAATYSADITGSGALTKTTVA
jgi:TP901-1 family phage major tail protein